LLLTLHPQLSLQSSQILAETFDGSFAPYICQLWLNFRKAYPWTQMVVAKSLVKLKEVAENEQS
jgi:hypothetical protein